MNHRDDWGVTELMALTAKRHPSAERVYAIGSRMGARLPHPPLSKPAQHMGVAPFSTSRFSRAMGEGTRYVRSSFAHIQPMPDPIAERGHRLVPWVCTVLGVALLAWLAVEPLL